MLKTYSRWFLWSALALTWDLHCLAFPSALRQNLIEPKVGLDILHEPGIRKLVRRMLATEIKETSSQLSGSGIHADFPSPNNDENDLGRLLRLFPNYDAEMTEPRLGEPQNSFIPKPHLTTHDLLHQFPHDPTPEPQGGVEEAPGRGLDHDPESSGPDTTLTLKPLAAVHAEKPIPVNQVNSSGGNHPGHEPAHEPKDVELAIPKPHELHLTSGTSNEETTTTTNNSRLTALGRDWDKLYAFRYAFHAHYRSPQIHPQDSMIDKDASLFGNRGPISIDSSPGYTDPHLSSHADATVHREPLVRTIPPDPSVRGNPDGMRYIPHNSIRHSTPDFDYLTQAQFQHPSNQILGGQTGTMVLELPHNRNSHMRKRKPKLKRKEKGPIQTSMANSGNHPNQPYFQQVQMTSIGSNNFAEAVKQKKRPTENVGPRNPSFIVDHNQNLWKLTPKPHETYTSLPNNIKRETPYLNNLNRARFQQNSNQTPEGQTGTTVPDLPHNWNSHMRNGETNLKRKYKDPIQTSMANSGNHQNQPYFPQVQMTSTASNNFAEAVKWPTERVGPRSVSAIPEGSASGPIYTIEAHP